MPRRYQEFLPKSLRGVVELYESGLDEHFLSVRDEIELLQARVADLLSEGGQSFSLANWESVCDLVSALRRVRDLPEDAVILINQIDGILLNEGVNQGRWDEIYRVTQMLEKLVSAERKDLIEKSKVFTSSQALSLLGAIEIALREIQDPEDRVRVGARIQSLMVNAKVRTSPHVIFPEILGPLPVNGHGHADG